MATDMVANATNISSLTTKNSGLVTIIESLSMTFTADGKQ